MTALTLAALVVSALMLPTAVVAAEPDAQAWWYLARNSGVPIETPVPPTVDDDGLYVAAGPNGAVAVAALRIEVGDAELVTVTLDLTDTSGDVVLGACRTEPWIPVQAGNWDERPEADCDAGSVAATLADDQAVASFDATTLVDDGVLDVILVPGSKDDGTPTSFTASIAPPGPDTLTVVTPTPVATPTTRSTDAPPAPAPSPAPEVAAPPSFRPAGGVVPPPEPETALEIPEPIEEVAAPVAPRPVVSVPGGSASDGGRLLGLALIACLGVGYVVLYGRQGPIPSPLLALGRDAPAEVAPEAPIRTVTSGIGRFSRERIGRPPPLT